MRPSLQTRRPGLNRPPRTPRSPPGPAGSRPTCRPSTSARRAAAVRSCRSARRHRRERHRLPGRGAVGPGPAGDDDQAGTGGRCGRVHPNALACVVPRRCRGRPVGPARLSRPPARDGRRWPNGSPANVRVQTGCHGHTVNAIAVKPNRNPQPSNAVSGRPPIDAPRPTCLPRPPRRSRGTGQEGNGDVPLVITAGRDEPPPVHRAGGGQQRPQQPAAFGVVGRARRNVGREPGHGRPRFADRAGEPQTLPQPRSECDRRVRERCSNRLRLHVWRRDAREGSNGRPRLRPT